MKRMNPNDRKYWTTQHYSKLFTSLTCSVGEWNRDKLLNELEKRLKKERMNK